MTTRGRPPIANLTAEEKVEKMKIYQREYQRNRYLSNAETSKQLQNSRRFLRELKNEHPDKGEAFQRDFDQFKINFKSIYELRNLLSSLPPDLVQAEIAQYQLMLN